MADAPASSGKIPGWVWIVVVLAVLFFLLRKTVDTVTKVSTEGTKNFGYGVGRGATDSAASAIGRFIGGLFTSKSDDDAGGPVDISGSVDWDRDPPMD